MNHRTIISSSRRAFVLLALLLPLSLIAGETVDFKHEKDGKITFEVTVYGKKGNLEKLACDKAMRSVMFLGVPGSNIANRPLAGPNEEEITRKHKKWFDNLYKKDYTRFITVSKPLTPYAKDQVTGKKGATFMIEIDARGLRQALEAQGIIRKFGY